MKPNWHEKRTSQPSQKDDSLTDIVAHDAGAGRVPERNAKKFECRLENIKHVPQDIVHQCLKNSWGIDEPERKYLVFKVA